MNLTDKMSVILGEKNIRYKIIAIDDSFVENTEAGESILKTAEIDSESIMSVIKEIINGSRI